MDETIDDLLIVCQKLVKYVKEDTNCSIEQSMKRV